jgi:hypothetical protein
MRHLNAQRLQNSMGFLDACFRDPFIVGAVILDSFVHIDGDKSTTVVHGLGLLDDSACEKAVV